MPDEAPLEWPEALDEEAGFHLSNLFPQDTGLPMTIWIGEKAGARQDARVRVSQAHGRRGLPDLMASVAVRPEPRLVQGELSTRDLSLVSAWIRLNEEVIVDHWEDRASSVDLVRRLRSLPA